MWDRASFVDHCGTESVRWIKKMIVVSIFRVHTLNRLHVRAGTCFSTQMEANCGVLMPFFPSPWRIRHLYLPSMDVMLRMCLKLHKSIEFYRYWTFVQWKKLLNCIKDAAKKRQDFVLKFIKYMVSDQCIDSCTPWYHIQHFWQHLKLVSEQQEGKSEELSFRDAVFFNSCTDFWNIVNKSRSDPVFWFQHTLFVWLLYSTCCCCWLIDIIFEGFKCFLILQVKAKDVVIPALLRFHFSFVLKRNWIELSFDCWSNKAHNRKMSLSTLRDCNHCFLNK